MELAATADAEALGSFAAWLERHGRHVRRLAIPSLERSVLEHDDAEAVARDYERCLRAAGAAGQLEELVFCEETGLLDGVDWPSAVTSLRRLHLDSGLLCIPPSLPTLTALRSLELRGGLVQPLQGHDGRLPSGLTRLGVAGLYASFLSRQARNLESCFCLIFWPSRTVLWLVDRPALARPGQVAAYLSSNQSGLRRRTGGPLYTQTPGMHAVL